MLAQLKISLDSDNLNLYKASTLQGVLFENIDSDFADLMHSQNIHPYSQYLIKEENSYFWIINTLNEESYNHIILPLINPKFKEFTLKKGNIDVKINTKELKQLSDEELLKRFYDEDADRNISVNIRTPMAFKQKGIYTIVPDIRLIFQSLMNKYSAAYAHMSMFDLDTLAQITENTFVTRYNLRSAAFAMEGIKIPGFIGKISFRFRGTETLARYARLLLEFAEFSGAGIKTAMGMGAICIVGNEVEK
ncbi:MAG: CRISPR-associated endoribonuclease Cas6 [Anaerovoracaceae bacterium]